MTGRVSIVTGAGRGIAQEIARSFADRGDCVVAIDLNLQRVKETVAQLEQTGASAMALAADVRDAVQVQQAVEQAMIRFGQIDVLVNAAGGYGQAYRPTHETPVDEWEMVLDSNLKGSFLFAKAVLPQMMRQSSGCIINFSSNAGRQTSPLLGASYTAAKAGVLGLTRHLANEYGEHGIRVNTIAPGPVNSDRVDELIGGEMQTRALIDQIPLGRLAETVDISDVVCFLSSEQARFITGAIIDVNGGYVLP